MNIQMCNMEKKIKVKDGEFDIIKKYTDEGWKVETTTRVQDSIEYVLTKADVSKKIKG